MTNEELSSILSPIYDYANELDSKGQGVATIGITCCNSADLVKYNILNLLLYISGTYNTNDLDLSIISDIAGYQVSDADIANSQANVQNDISVLSIVPESFILFANADRLAGTASYENSWSQTLVMLYMLILTRFFKCTLDELQQKNQAVYNYIKELNSTIQAMVTPPSNTANSGTGETQLNQPEEFQPGFTIDPATGEMHINRTRRRTRARQTCARRARALSDSDSYSQSDARPPTISQFTPSYTYPEPQQKKSWVKPVVITAVVLFILGLLLGL